MEKQSRLHPEDSGLSLESRKLREDVGKQVASHTPQGLFLCTDCNHEVTMHKVLGLHTSP